MDTEQDLCSAMASCQSSVLFDFPAAIANDVGLAWSSLHHRTVNHDMSMCTLVVVLIFSAQSLPM